jgi:NADPH:quinone reductase-like Zn-dependent oxidoreductase
VVAVGEDITRAKLGDRVSASCHPHWMGGPPRPEYQLDSLGMTTDGWFAEHIVLHESAIVHLPDYISYAEAASLPYAAVTAWTALNLSSSSSRAKRCWSKPRAVSPFRASDGTNVRARVLAITSSARRARR